MKIFDSYKEVITKAVANDPIAKFGLNNVTDFQLTENRNYLKGLNKQLPSIELTNEAQLLMKGMGAPSTLSYPRLGNHPDFAYLRGTEETEEHWIISGFIDVRGSTKLFNHFAKSTVKTITESIVRASIFAVNLNGGYVHRIQGDGLMVYFGGKEMDKKDATKDALKAFSMISYFVKNDLKEFFESNGIDDIHTRSGIDLGHSKQVEWFYSGVGDSGEVTTCSLHTSLAPKMQSKAHLDGIVVGQNIRNQIGKDKYFDKRSQPIHDYGDGRTYDHYNFNWQMYLVDEGLAVQHANGALVLTMTTTPTPERVDSNLYNIASKNKPFLDGDKK